MGCCFNWVDRCCFLPFAKMWCCPPTVVKWDGNDKTYPLLEGDAKRNEIAVFAGSFNPPHIGHGEIMRYISNVHEQVIVVIGVNPDKTYSVTPEQRKEILQLMVQSFGLTNVRVMMWETEIFKLANQEGASVFYRGIRTWNQDGPGERHLQVQNLCWPVCGFCWGPMSTRFIESRPELVSLSSTRIREALLGGEDLTDLVPKECIEKMKNAYAQ